MFEPTGDILIENGRARWVGNPIMRTSYASLLYMPRVEFKLPLGLGSRGKVGRIKLIVIAEEPETATVLVRRGGLWGWLWWLVTKRFKRNDTCC